MRDTIIIYSGGMDSTTLLHENADRIGLAINYNYGGKHNKREVQFAKANCKQLGIPLQVINLIQIFKNLKSNLLIGGEDIPKGHYEDESMKKNVVPFRNGIMLAIAAGIAESHNFTRILIANHFGDHAIFPDCRQNFADAIGQAITEGTWERIKLDAPYTTITKRQIALRGKAIPALNYKTTWSCYVGGKLHCGECGTCIERREALAGFDPTIYLN